MKNNYKKKEYFFNTGELKFFNLLKEMIKDKYYIFPKVRIIDLVDVKKGIEQQINFNKIKSKHVDYVICRKRPIETWLIIELDGQTHKLKKIKEADELKNKVFKEAGIPIARVEYKKEITEKEVLEIINNAFKNI